jgi:CRISPR-associated protein Csd2
MRITPLDFEQYISAEVRALYDVNSYRHAAAIFVTLFPSELSDVERALLNFRITRRDIGLPGGNESVMPKKISRILRPAGWVESRIQGDLLVRMQDYEEFFLPDDKIKKVKRSGYTSHMIENFIDGHKIDYVKGRVAFDLEWNSKDQTFGRPCALGSEVYCSTNLLGSIQPLSSDSPTPKKLPLRRIKRTQPVGILMGGMMACPRFK